MHLLMRRKLAHSVNAFLVTLLLAGLYSLVYVADVTPHRIEKTNRFLVLPAKFGIKEGRESAGNARR
jgi:hypothetical protein